MKVFFVLVLAIAAASAMLEIDINKGEIEKAVFNDQTEIKKDPPLVVNSFENNIEGFKETMNNCFTNWATIAQEGHLKDSLVAIIEDVVTNTLGEEKLMVKLKDGTTKLVSETIYALYQTVPYHNVCHGIMVSYYTYLFTAGYVVEPVKRKALVLGGLLHDIGHNGYTNPNCGKLGESGSNFCKLTLNGNKNGCVAVDYKANNFQSVSKYVVKEANSQLVVGLHGVLPSEDDAYVAISKEILDIWRTTYANSEPIKDVPNQWKAIDVAVGLCGSAELHHAMIASQMLKNIFSSKLNGPFYVGEDFRDEVVLSILFTYMGFYQFFTGTPTYYFKDEQEHPHQWHSKAVHMADLMATGDSHDALRATMRVMVVKEFRKEFQQFVPGRLREAKTLSGFLGSQAFFLNAFVIPQTKELLGVPNGEYKNQAFWDMYALATKVDFGKLTEIADANEKIDHFKTELASINNNAEDNYRII